MDNTNDKIFFNFSYFALKLLGKGLYSNPWTAIAELVANGLDAKATCVRIFIDMSDKKNSEIEIFDNGTGMTYSDLAEKYVLYPHHSKYRLPWSKTLRCKGSIIMLVYSLFS